MCEPARRVKLARQACEACEGREDFLSEFGTFNVAMASPLGLLTRKDF
jgi:hypothetical protein